jgi:hypothetical protein
VEAEFDDIPDELEDKIVTVQNLFDIVGIEEEDEVLQPA